MRTKYSLVAFLLFAVIGGNLGCAQTIEVLGSESTSNSALGIRLKVFVFLQRLDSGEEYSLWGPSGKIQDWRAKSLSVERTEELTVALPSGSKKVAFVLVRKYPNGESEVVAEKEWESPGSSAVQAEGKSIWYVAAGALASMCGIALEHWLQGKRNDKAELSRSLLDVVPAISNALETLDSAYIDTLAAKATNLNAVAIVRGSRRLKRLAGQILESIDSYLQDQNREEFKRSLDSIRRKLG